VKETSLLGQTSGAIRVSYACMDFKRIIYWIVYPMLGFAAVGISSFGLFAVSWSLSDGPVCSTGRFYSATVDWWLLVAIPLIIGLGLDRWAHGNLNWVSYMPICLYTLCGILLFGAAKYQTILQCEDGLKVVERLPAADATTVGYIANAAKVVLILAAFSCTGQWFRPPGPNQNPVGQAD